METIVVPPQRNPNALLQSFIVGQLASELLRRELEPTGMTRTSSGCKV